MEELTLSPTQLAYIAGLIDGEGSLECQRELARKRVTPCFTPRLAFVFSTNEPLKTFCSWLGVTPKWFPTTDERRQARWRIGLTKSLTMALLKACLPYLILKRDQAELILEIERVRAAYSPGRKTQFGILRRFPQEGVDQLEALYLDLRRLKSNKRPVSARIS
jgi:hypothetical protein